MKPSLVTVLREWGRIGCIGFGGLAVLFLAWTAFKVGALSYGGGFVIVPLMQPTRSTTTTG